MENNEINSSTDLSEEDTKQIFITKQLENAGWICGVNFRMEVPIKDGRIIGENKRQPAEFADYVLYYKIANANKPIAVVEAKKLRLPLGTGRDQAINYAEKIGARFAFCTNGTGFICVDLSNNTERKFGPNEFPNHDELLKIYFDNEAIPETFDKL
ncbi:type I restriction enzyme HsdR N-terminal domain-containing protein [bacterium]|nr:type I restriction enzyme HsdR N-terminal domain-containing protein [bacterium]